MHSSEPNASSPQRILAVEIHQVGFVRLSIAHLLDSISVIEQLLTEHLLSSLVRIRRRGQRFPCAYLQETISVRFIDRPASTTRISIEMAMHGSGIIGQTGKATVTTDALEPAVH